MAVEIDSVLRLTGAGQSAVGEFTTDSEALQRCIKVVVARRLDFQDVNLSNTSELSVADTGNNRVFVWYSLLIFPISFQLSVDYGAFVELRSRADFSEDLFMCSFPSHVVTFPAFMCLHQLFFMRRCDCNLIDIKWLMSSFGYSTRNACGLYLILLLT